MASKEWPEMARTTWAVHLIADDGVDSFGFPTKEDAQDFRDEFKGGVVWISRVIPLRAGVKYWVVHVKMDDGQMKSFGFEKRAQADTFNRKVGKAEGAVLVSEPTKSELSS